MRHNQRHFGVEIECVTDHEVATEACRIGGPGWRQHGEHCGVEIVSPPLTQNSGFRHLKRVMDFLKPQARVTDACGQHVHLEASDLSLQTVRRFVYSWENNQKHIMQMVDPSRWSNGYANRWTTQDFRRLDDICNPRPEAQNNEPRTNYTFHEDSWHGWYIVAPGTGARIYSNRWDAAVRADWDRWWPWYHHQQVLRRRAASGGSGRFYNIGRYKTVNVASLPEHGTIEIRQHHATLEYEEAEAWIKFSMGFLCDVADRKRIIKEYKTPAHLLRYIKVDKEIKPIINEKLLSGGRLLRDGTEPIEHDPYEYYEGDNDDDGYYDDDYDDDDGW